MNYSRSATKKHERKWRVALALKANSCISKDMAGPKKELQRVPFFHDRAGGRI